MDKLACFMYRILFVGAFVCITASANLMLDYKWPVPDPNINRFPHESSCHYYYVMLSEEDISIQKCPDGQLFDYVKHSCIPYKEHIHCWSRHFGKIKHGHVHIKHKKHFKCPYPWGKYPNLHDCTKYHLCLNGKSKVKRCAPFELFDKISRKCIASIDAVCADKTDVVEHGYECPKTWGSFTYSKDCSKYYECLQRKPSLRMCLKGYLFDDRLAKCTPKEHVYCGLRHNPYEKISSDAPEAHSKTFTQNTTIVNMEVTTITAKEKITSVKPSSQEIKPTLQETSTIFKKITSFPQEASSIFKEITSLSQETSTTFQKIMSLPEEISTFHDNFPASTEASTNQPITDEILSPSAVPVADKIQIKQESSIATTIPNLLELEGQHEISDATNGLSGKVEMTNDESDDLKKDVSTEEKHTDERKSDSNPDSPSETGCLMDDPMCLTEKDGTVVKCSSSKDLQPHPKDERRFLDCTEFEIQIHTCPPNLTFNPHKKKCEWQFIL